MEINYERLKGICRSIVKDNDVDEILHFCIDQAYSNPKFSKIENDDGKIYFFTKIVLNNIKSNSSRYFKTYRKHVYEEVGGLEIGSTEDYEESPIDLEWVYEEIKKLKVDEWYFARLFELYIQEGCSLTKLHLRTTIPLVSLSRDIRYVREKLKIARNKTLNK